MEETLKEILAELKSLNKRVGSLEKGQQELRDDVTGIKSDLDDFRAEVKNEFAAVHQKLDTLYEQVAHNTEQTVKLEDVIGKVEKHEKYISQLKKALSN